MAADIHGGDERIVQRLVVHTENRNKNRDRDKRKRIRIDEEFWYRNLSAEMDGSNLIEKDRKSVV